MSLLEYLNWCRWSTMNEWRLMNTRNKHLSETLTHYMQWFGCPGEVELWNVIGGVEWFRAMFPQPSQSRSETDIIQIISDIQTDDCSARVITGDRISKTVHHLSIWSVPHHHWDPVAFERHGALQLDGVALGGEFGWIVRNFTDRVRLCETGWIHSYLLIQFCINLA